jgi:hypothetical protein
MKKIKTNKGIRIGMLGSAKWLITCIRHLKARLLKKLEEQEEDNYFI